MKILVTGGAGFIASHIVDAYIRAGHRVVVIDNLSTGSRKNVHPKAKFYRADIRDPERIRTIFKRERPDVVNHHAAQVSVIESVRDPASTYETNVVGIANLCIAFAEHGRGIRKFIFASTGGALYGEPRVVPCNERTPVMPLAPYGLSKHLGEQMLQFYARQSGFSHLILRYANVYGPRQSPRGEAGVVAIFSRLMRQNKRPIIFGDGTKSRDYVFVQDIVGANLKALSRTSVLPLNIGTGRLTTDKEVFDRIAAALGYTGKPRYAAARPGEVYRIALDARRARKVLGWKPRTDFSRGIAQTAPTYRP